MTNISYRRPLNEAEKEWILEEELAEEQEEGELQRNLRPRFDWRQRAFSRRLHDKGANPQRLDEFRYVRRMKRNREDYSPMGPFKEQAKAYRDRSVSLFISPEFAF
jgi:hypothetical protein